MKKLVLLGLLLGVIGLFCLSISAAGAEDVWTDQFRLYSDGKLIASYDREDCLKVEGKSNLVPVVVIDSGFDLTHPDFSGKIWKNPKEILGNGRDDDEDGFIDNPNGWYWESGPNIGERVLVFFPPYSHGTHVASTALRDIEGFGLVGFVGKNNEPEFLRKINTFLRVHQVKFVNMSFDLGIGYSDNAYVDDSPLSQEIVSSFGSLIAGNPDTLFFVSAGNLSHGENGEWWDIDRDDGKKIIYPAGFGYDNMIVVGALNTDEIRPEDIGRYKVADLSVIGRQSIDIFAPGERMVGAAIGGGALEDSGTSFSAPYVLNVALKIYKENPLLTTAQIKEIIMESAIVPTTGRLPCVTGGAINPSGAILLAGDSKRIALKGKE